LAMRFQSCANILHIIQH